MVELGRIRPRGWNPKECLILTRTEMPKCLTILKNNNMALETSQGDWMSSLKDLKLNKWRSSCMISLGYVPPSSDKMMGLIPSNFELSKSSQLPV